MYNIAPLKPFILKTTNGNKKCYYGNCDINISGVLFDNIRNRNKPTSTKPFIIEKTDPYYNTTNAIKLKSTTHIIAVDYHYFIDYQHSRIEMKTSDINYNKNLVQTIPNLNDGNVFNAYSNFINSIQNKPIKKTLKAIFHNITHGDTPYSNVDFQSQDIQNCFVMSKDDLDYPYDNLNNPTFTGINNYPQNAIILIASTIDTNKKLKYPLFFYQSDNISRDIRFADEYYTMPCYGIMDTTNDVIYFYWTTYKGV